MYLWRLKSEWFTSCFIYFSLFLGPDRKKSIPGKKEKAWVVIDTHMYICNSVIALSSFQYRALSFAFMYESNFCYKLWTFLPVSSALNKQAVHCYTHTPILSCIYVRSVGGTICCKRVATWWMNCKSDDFLMVMELVFWVVL